MFILVFPPCNQVTSGYKAKTIVTALPGSFLDPLLSPSLMEDYELRQLVLEVMHNLMDRHDNRAKLRGIRYWAILKQLNDNALKFNVFNIVIVEDLFKVLLVLR